MSQPREPHRPAREPSSTSRRGSAWSHTAAWLLRCLAGALAALVVAASLDARATATAAEVEWSTLFMPAWALLLPAAVFVGLGVGFYFWLAESGPVRGPLARLEGWRELSPLGRSRAAALALLAPLGVLGATVAMAHAARTLLGEGAPKDVGAALSLAAVACCGLAVLAVLGLASPLRRLLAVLAGPMPRLLDPALTLFVGVAVTAFLVGIGLRQGDASGDGPVLGILAVLTRPELDLRPVAGLLVVVAGALLGPALFRVRLAVVAVTVLVLLGVPAWILVHNAHNMDEGVAAVVEQHAGLGKPSLALARKLGDRDGDGVSAWFAGGDCDDRDPAISPLAIDIPGNGIDEDCSGSDAPLAQPKPVAPVEAVERPELPGDLNLILITVDTLRHDLGFAGNPRPVSPRLDALAAKSVVFERAYSLASYTGKSIPPLLIGKYPSECPRDGNHFTAYPKENVFLAERLKDAGFRTFGGASLFYLSQRFNIPQGIDDWDTSAQTPGGDKDNIVTSDKITDVALAQLAKPENTDGRFFAWYHYMDPHAEYLRHKGAPDMGNEVSASRALYDGEVWFTDQQIGRIFDAVEAAPWGKRTVIVVTSDHGEAFADHGMNWHGRELWESLVRVPWIIHVPGLGPHRVPAKRSHVDFVPTMLDVLGLPAAAAGELSGQSMLPDLVKSEGFAERDVYVDMPLGPYNSLRRALVRGEGAGMKLIHSGGRLYQLYDLNADPAEANDLSKDKAQLTPMVEAMEQLRAGLKELDVKPVQRN